MLVAGFVAYRYPSLDEVPLTRATAE